MMSLLIGLVQLFRQKNWSIRKVTTVCGTKVIYYNYNGKVYIYVGDVLPTQTTRGFCAPIAQAVWNGKDVTKLVKTYAGPRHDFYGQDPPLECMFYRVSEIQWVPSIKMIPVGVYLEFRRVVTTVPTEGILTITNVLGQTSVFGAKKNFMSPKLATE
jgi:hypothetical protein